MKHEETGNSLWKRIREKWVKHETHETHETKKDEQSGSGFGVYNKVFLYIYVNI